MMIEFILQKKEEKLQQKQKNRVKFDTLFASLCVNYSRCKRVIVRQKTHKTSYIYK